MSYNGAAAGLAQSFGTFNVGWTNGLAGALQAWNWMRSGQELMLYPTVVVSGVGVGVTFNAAAASGVPAGLRPIQEAVFGALSATNNGASVACTLRFGTNGTIILGNSAFDYNAAWTAGGTREFPATNLGLPVFTYRLA